MRRFVLFAASIVFWWSSAASAIPVEWTVASGGNGHFYEVFLGSGISWDSARSDSLALGDDWDLASITSQAERDFVITLLPPSPANRDHLWLGGRDVNAEGIWEWSNGDAFTYDGWWDGEPSDTFGEDHMAIDFRLVGTSAAFTGWRWNDISNPHPNIVGYVSEQSIAPIPEPSTALLLGLGLLGFSARKGRPASRI